MTRFPPIGKLARALIAGASENDPEPSWSALGKLIEEEQFVEIANFLGVASDATETSFAELVDAVWPMVKGIATRGMSRVM